VALALQADGWWLRSDVIWCLSGGTSVYVKTDNSGICLMNVKDLARVKPNKTSLWNGEKWTRMLGVSQSPRKGNEITFTLRSGERISCTPTHRFPTNRGLLAASDMQIGDVIDSTRLPEPERPKDCAIDEAAAWFAGLYLAEGSMSGDTIQLAGHSSDSKRLELVDAVVAKYGGNWTVDVDGNKQSIRVYGKLLVAILKELVSGRTAHDKGFSPSVWRYSNQFVSAMLQGYLDGDGHWDVANGRWRLGFCRNYNLERDLRTTCARLGYRLTLNLSSVKYLGKDVPTFRGEIRMERSGHHNEKSMGEVVEIGRARCRDVYDIGVADNPHLFALSSGTLTHNSKPNSMPESVTDRPTRSHEYIFMLTKSARYYWDAEAVKENYAPITIKDREADHFSYNGVDLKDYANNGVQRPLEVKQRILATMRERGGRNIRSVWTITTKPCKEAHFATFPPDLPEKCIKAATSEKGVCPKCGKQWERETERKTINRDGWGKSDPKHSTPQGTHGPSIRGDGRCGDVYVCTTGWRPGCECGLEPIPASVFDPFGGAGTVAVVAAKLGRSSVSIELNPAYCAIAEKRIAAATRQGKLAL